MVNKVKSLIIIVLFFTVSFIFPQVKDKIKNKQTELSRIKAEISLLESQLKIKTTKEKQSNTALENYSKQNYLLNTLINRLREEEQLKQEDIEFTLHQIEYIGKEIKILQSNYSKYVISVYKKGKDDELAALLNSESLQQALIRYKYLQKFSEKRAKDFGEFQKNKQDLLVLKNKYEKDETDYGHRADFDVHCCNRANFNEDGAENQQIFRHGSAYPGSMYEYADGYES